VPGRSRSRFQARTSDKCRQPLLWAFPPARAERLSCACSAIARVGTDNSFSQRGVGSLNFSPNVDSSVGIAIDEVSLGVPLFINYFGFEDIDRVQGLLGPQGLLFRRNASAGLLSVITKRPEPGGDISGHIYGELDYRDGTPGSGWGEIVRGTINVPLSPAAAIRLNGFYSDQDPIATVVNRAADAKFKISESRDRFIGQPHPELGALHLDRGRGLRAGDSEKCYPETRCQLVSPVIAELQQHRQARADLYRIGQYRRYLARVELDDANLGL
jgi:outer membrane receptor protein involved in Fe transport